MSALHVHGEVTLTLDSGRVLCNCGYERFEFDDGHVCWGVTGVNMADPADREVLAARRMICNRKLVA